MRLLLFIGLPHCGLDDLQSDLFDGREALLARGLLVPRFGRKRSHSRLYMAVSDPDRPDPLRVTRGLQAADMQARLRQAVRDDLVAAAERHPEAGSMVICAAQLSTLAHRSELERLRDLLRPVSEEVSVVLTVDEQARLLLRHYAHAVQNGRTAPLMREVELARSGADWFTGAVAGWTAAEARPGQFPEVFGVPHWLDFGRLVSRWEEVFGQGRVSVMDRAAIRPDGRRGVSALAHVLTGGGPWPVHPAAVTRPRDLPEGDLARWRLVNAALLARSGGEMFLSRGFAPTLRPLITRDGREAGATPRPGSLSVLSRRFEADNHALCAAHPALPPSALRPDAPVPDWAEPPPGAGFDAEAIAEGLARTLPQTALTEPEAAPPAAAVPVPQVPGLAELPPEITQALAQAAQFKGGPYEPHNRMGSPDESTVGPAFAEVSGGGAEKALIVGCMKNEAPYIVEWVAYHRQIGIDDFLIYTNDCSDGTDAILQRLQEMGLVQHRSNDEWKGQSPQQHALNMSLKEKVMREAVWIAHIDVDEFINVRVGNGTLQDLLAHMPGATNVALTWRLFGHNGIRGLEDRLVIDQFDHAAPRYCPKPHTNWGFKTLTRNVGMYEKLSCHRPTKPVSSRQDGLRWYNGSGKVMSPQYHEKGWRSDRANIGYDLVQLNHYALRSAEAFLVKRQRGRALHVDRSIGLSYWMRMDWNSHPDRTIKRNIPRVQAEMARMFEDATLRRLHEEGVAWHKAKVAELRALPEFEDLYHQVMEIRLSELERVAVSLALEK